MRDDRPGAGVEHRPHERARLRPWRAGPSQHPWTLGDPLARGEPVGAPPVA